MLLLSDEAIYIFQYLALMGEPAHDYLNNMLNHIASNLDTLVPYYILELNQQSHSKGDLSGLFQSIVKCGEVTFFAEMLD